MATNEPKIDWKALEAITKKVLAFKPKKKEKKPSSQESPNMATGR